MEKSQKQLKNDFRYYTLEYKTEQCKNECFVLEWSQCKYYHNESDRRRDIIQEKVDKDKDNDQELREFQYDSWYIGEEISQLNISQTQFKGCQNIYEYLYHPINYKQQKCIFDHNNTEADNCAYYHDENEKETIKQLKKKYLSKFREYPIKNSFKKVYDNLIQKLNEKDTELQLKMQSPVIIKPLKPNEERNYILNSKVQFSPENYAHISDPGLEPYEAVIYGRMLFRYICGLMNSNGGTIYFGIDKDNIVRGFEMTQKDIDLFQREVDTQLKEFHPDLQPREYSIRFYQVKQNYFVIEIHLKKIHNELFFYQYFQKDDNERYKVYESWVYQHDKQKTFRMLKPDEIKTKLKLRLEQTLDEDEFKIIQEYDMIQEQEINNYTINQLDQLENKLKILKNNLKKARKLHKKQKKNRNSVK